MGQDGLRNYFQLSDPVIPINNEPSLSTHLGRVVEGVTFHAYSKNINT